MNIFAEYNFNNSYEKYRESYYENHRATRKPLSPSSYSKKLADHDNVSKDVIFLDLTDETRNIHIDDPTQFGTDVHDGIQATIEKTPLDTALTDYHKLMIDRAFKLCPELYTAEAEVNVSGKFANKDFAGQADAIIHNSDGTLTIVDFKNYKTVTEWDLSNHTWQLKIYAHLAAQQYGKPVKDIKVIYNRQNVMHTEEYHVEA